MDSALEDKSVELFKRRIFLSLILPLLFILLLWIIRFVEYEFDISLYTLGVLPLTIKGLPGIFLSPLIHADARHLLNNSFPLIILGSALFYFYSDIALRVIMVSWIWTGILVWLLGRESWHIGASGLIYSLAAFLFVSGILRSYMRLLALSLLVAYLYGSMVWGMFPFVDVHISWEAHMMGAFCGVILAFWYRKEGPQKPEVQWLDDDEDDIGDPDNDENILVDEYKENEK